MDFLEKKAETQQRVDELQKKVTSIEKEILDLGVVVTRAMDDLKKAENSLESGKSSRVEDYIANSNSSDLEQRILVMKNDIERFNTIISDLEKSIWEKHRQLNDALEDLRDEEIALNELIFKDLLYKFDEQLKTLVPIITNIHNHKIACQGHERHLIKMSGPHFLFGHRFSNHCENWNISNVIPSYSNQHQSIFDRSKLDYSGVKRLGIREISEAVTVIINTIKKPTIPVIEQEKPKTEPYRHNFISYSGKNF
jgi:acetone carboxylase gamma subunit